MRRTERLFQIIQILRRKRRPITAVEIAEELETSVRTIYRDMAELIAQGVPIFGEAGIGYVLRDGYDMPPLMLTADELEAAILGAKWVALHGDKILARGADDLIAKLSVSLPSHLQPIVGESALTPLSFQAREEDSCDLSLVRSAIRTRNKLHLAYADEAGVASSRTVWPFAIAYTDRVRMICAWCELRNDFRVFRTDRIKHADVLDDRFRTSVEVLQKRWKVHDKGS